MKKFNALVLASMLAMTSLLVACDNDSDVAENVDEIVNDTKRAVEDATD